AARTRIPLSLARPSATTLSFAFNRATSAPETGEPSGVLSLTRSSEVVPCPRRLDADAKATLTSAYQMRRVMHFLASMQPAQLPCAILKMLFPEIMYNSPPKSTPKDVTLGVVRPQSFWSTATPFS